MTASPMTKGALALLITGGTENWSPPRWRERFTAVCPDRPVALLPADKIDPAAVHYAAVWKPYLVEFMKSLGPAKSAEAN